MLRIVFVFFVVVVVDGGVVGVPPFSLFSHLVVVLVSGMTVSRRLGRRRHARAFSHSLLFSLFSFCFLVGYFTFYLQPVILGDLLSCTMTAVCLLYLQLYEPLLRLLLIIVRCRSTYSEERSE